MTEFNDERPSNLSPDTQIADQLATEAQSYLDKTDTTRKLARRRSKLTKAVGIAAFCCGLGIGAVGVSASNYFPSRGQLRADQKRLQENQLQTSKETGKFMAFRNSLGQKCVAAIEPYSPSGLLRGIPTEDAALQIGEDGQCGGRDTNLQAAIQEYRDSAKTIDSSLRDKHAIEYDIAQDKDCMTIGMDLGIGAIGLMPGGVVGAVGAAIAMGMVDERNPHK